VRTPKQGSETYNFDLHSPYCPWFNPTEFAFSVSAPSSREVNEIMAPTSKKTSVTLCDNREMCGVFDHSFATFRTQSGGVKLE
jgi:hypothetical protein